MATPSWLAATWEFMDKFNIHIDLPLPRFQLRRDQDAFIMEKFVEAGATSRELGILNRCRLFLRVITFADIFEADGHTITLEAWQGRPMQELRKGYQWPIQGRPGEFQWRKWRSFLRRIFKLRQRRSPAQVLGDWVEDGNANGWNWFYCRLTNALYRNQGGIVSKFRIRTRHATCRTFVREGISRGLPEEANRCTVRIISRNKVKVTSTGPPTCDQLPERSIEVDDLKMVTETDNMKLDSIIEGIISGNTIAVSDGSFKPGKGTAAFGFLNRITGMKFRGCLRSPGHAEDQSPYRSELVGLAGIIKLVRNLEKEGKIPHGRIEVACDGKSALYQIFRQDQPTRTNIRHYDIISYCRALIAESKTCWTYRHVKGHQDEFTHNLDEWERLNVEMDWLAKRYWNWDSAPDALSCRSREAGFVTVSMDGNPITSTLQKSIHQKVGFARWWKWWSLKQSESGLQSDNIDFPAIKLAFSSLSVPHRILVMKQAHGTCGVGKWMAKWKETTDGSCARCGQANEDMIHVWKCPKSSQWEVILRNWNKWLRRNQCPDRDRISFCNEWSRWRRDQPIISLEDCSDEMRNAITDRRRIGWNNFSHGYISNEWGTAIKQWGNKRYHTSASSLVRLIWEAGRDLWNERNEPLYTTNNIRFQRTTREINRSIIREYRRGYEDLQDMEADLFNEGLGNILSRSRNGKRDWLSRVHTAKARKRRRTGEEIPAYMRDEFVRDQLLIKNWTKRWN